MISPPPSPPATYLDLRRTLYSGFSDFDADERVLRQAWSFFIHQPDAVWHDGKTFCCGIYRMADHRWAFGFFETKGVDQAAFQSEWQSLRMAFPGAWAGPLQGSTFLPYRFITSGESHPLFPGEWRNQAHYGPWMEQLGPSRITTYRSAYRTEYREVIAVSEAFLTDWEERGFALRPFDLEDADGWTALHYMIEAIFHGNWGYKALTPAEFTSWAQSLGQSHGGQPWLYWVYIGERRIGFAYLFFLEDGTLIFKTIGLLPEFQAQKVGNAVAGKLHKMALEAGATRCIYALVQAENRVNRMPDPDITVFRTYASYEFDPLPAHA